jgi:hypothetical protein
MVGVIPRDPTVVLDETEELVCAYNTQYVFK